MESNLPRQTVEVDVDVDVDGDAPTYFFFPPHCRPSSRPVSSDGDGDGD